MKISILSPSYNSEKYIERAINSVLDQDYKDWEHIIYDAGSTDGTIEILRKYPHLKWFSEPDKGQSDAMNKAFDKASGDLIAYLNTDDYFDKNVFGRVIQYFKNKPSTKFLFGNIKKVFIDKVVDFQASTSLMEILQYWPCRFPGNPVGYFYRREVQIEVGPFPVNNHFTMDYWFILRVYRKYRVDYLPVNFGFYQLTDGKSIDLDRAKKSLKKVRNEFLLENQKVFLLFLLRKLKIRIKRWV